MEGTNKTERKEIKKDKDLKNRVRYTASYDKELLQAARNLSSQIDVPLSKLLDKAIEYLLDQDKTRLKSKFEKTKNKSSNNN